MRRAADGRLLLLLACAAAAAAAAAAADAVGDGGEESEDEAALLQVSLLQRDLHLHHPAAAARPGAARAEARASLLQGGRGGGERSHLGSHVRYTYTVDLDLPPEERWKGLYLRYRERVLGMLWMLMPKTPEEKRRRDDFISNFDLGADEVYLAEFRGILDAVNDSRLELNDLLWVELGYEHGESLGCTAVLAANENGTVYHGRNLDLPDAAMLMKTLVDITFTRGGDPIAYTTTFPFMVGIHTAIRLDGYSVAQNTRHGVEDAAGNLQAARKGARPFQFFLRHLVDEVQDWKTAVKRTASAYFAAPQYFTIAGPGPYQGALITRDREGNDEEPYANVLMLSPQIDRWYIVQTNDDANHPPLDHRRGAALKKLHKMRPPEVNQDSMTEVMLIDPVRNDKTIFTWVVEPKANRRHMLLGNETTSPF